jgi:DNA-binding PadR family transcriptional regulator
MMTNAELAILSLVAERPRHGYEIEQVIEERGMRDWTAIGFSSIYHVLNKLERGQLVQARLERGSGRGPARKVYQVLPAGGQALKQGLLEALDKPSASQQEFLLWLANIPLYTAEEVGAAVARYRQRLAARQVGLRAKAAAQPRLPPYIQAMFEYSLALVAAELGWLESWNFQKEAENDQAGL